MKELKSHLTPKYKAQRIKAIVRILTMSFFNISPMNFPKPI